MTVNDQNHKFHGTVLLVLGDTLALHDLAGFKVGVGFSLRICRDCMATAEMIQHKVSLRKIFSHLLSMSIHYSLVKMILFYGIMFLMITTAPYLEEHLDQKIQ